MVLSRDNINEIFCILLSVLEKWYEIGKELGVQEEILVRIKTQCTDPVDCLHKVLMEWLESASSPPTWNVLADALCSCNVNEEALAKKGMPRAVQPCL